MQDVATELCSSPPNPPASPNINSWYCGASNPTGPTACCQQCVTYTCPENDPYDPEYLAKLKIYEDCQKDLTDYYNSDAYLAWRDEYAKYLEALKTCQKGIFYPTISDLAKYYYDTDLSPASIPGGGLPNYVPTTAHDNNSKQHLVVYSVALGLTSSLIQSDYAAYRDDPYFDNHPQPNWTKSSTPYCIPPYSPQNLSSGVVDYLWHASVVSKGIFYNVDDAGALTNAFKAIVASIGATPQGVGAAAVSSGGRLNDSAAVYVGRYDTSDWSGQLTVYSVSKSTGKRIETDDPTKNWEASAKLNDLTPANRRIFTSNGKGKGLEFSLTGLNSADFTSGQRQMLGDTPDNHNAFTSNIDYIRGNDISGMRARANILGDIIHSSPVLLRSATMGVIDPSDPDKGTIYIGANDGMLHAFNVKDGEERFAFIPSQAHDHLLALTSPQYVDNHRYYIDATPVVGRMTFFDANKQRTKDMRLLVSGLGRGGRGYFALKVADITGSGASRTVKQAEDITSGTSMSSDITNMLQWEYPRRDMIATPKLDVTDQAITEYTTTSDTCVYQPNGKNNPDGDGELWCAPQAGAPPTQAYLDEDLGYSYSAPTIFPSNARQASGLKLPSNDLEHPWVVVFGNGYGSQSGRAVLYVLDALSGKLIKKIDTKSDPKNVNTSVKNGLSSPAELDIDGDGLVDFVYAGDLYGNLWKFDFRSKDPKDWDVVKDNGNNPQPLFTTMQNGSSIRLGQPITSRPDIVAHNKKKGYIIVFGTGQFLGPGDFADTNTQSLFGIWDSDIPSFPAKLTKYLGAWKRDENGNPGKAFPDAAGTFPNASLLQQVVRFQGTPLGAQCGENGCPEVRVVSNNPITWYNKDDSAHFSHVGWYLDLPGLETIGFDSAPVFPSPKASERIIDDVRIRYGKVIAVSFTPGEGICSAGGSSVLMELSAYTGGGPKKAQLNLGSGTLGVGDYFQLGGNSYTASGLIMNGKTTIPTIIPGTDPRTEYKVQFNSTGTAMSTLEERPAPIFFWREASKN